MRYRTTLLLAIVLPTLLAGQVAPQEKSTTRAAPDAFATDIRALTTFVRERWSYLQHRRKLSGVDIDQLEREALQLLGQARSRRGFLRALTRYVAGLEDGHAWVRLKGVTLAEKDGVG